ncbi:hypothetical protein ColTof4_11668 [Colletotrichum tofieldiae]|uniref:Celp0028 effector like protein n=1 Tax=Colletotrichum tofieldiae TaxID=708197 RepID=A0A161W4M0_9PEZI|nr:hypothetical protein CT0861_08913 [Colletotrichum tofieldiae]GKT55919.1 hypothetical protein ColTof3_03258 [Colletotrichum tofieldiae]GKT79245.1 hypothetical protein ColTof4_11668 [Colletotrichum tofieldiae]
MRFSVLAAAGLIGAAAAAPAPAPVALNFDDVIVVGEDGTHQVMKSAEYDALQARAALAPAPAIKSLESVSRRGCEESTEVQVITDDQFLNWDVAISPVLSSIGGSATVSVANGYSIANSVSVTSGLTATVEGVLGMSLSVSYSETWTTTETQTLGFTVPDGQYGLVVSQPNVRRVTGNILSGCTDSPSKTEFTSDTYTSQSYGNLAWVKGVIRLCNSTTYPVPYCIGNGEHR